MVKMNHFAAPFLGFVRKLLHPTGLAAGLLLVTALSCCAAAEAQSAYFSGQAAGIGSGFNTPSGVAVDASGNVFVADPANNAVQEIVAAGGYVTVNTIGSGFSAPNAVAVDASGNVFVADTGNSAVKEILAAGGYVTVNAVGSGFLNPSGVALDAAGNLYVADTGNNSVEQVLAAGGYTTINFLGLNFAGPMGVAVDRDGNVFVADTINNQVEEILAPAYTTQVTLGPGFVAPTGVAVDAGDNVYVADGASGALFELLAASGYSTVNSLAILNPAGAGPQGVTVAANGKLYVADAANHLVESIQLNSVDFGAATVAGTPASLPLSFTFNAGVTLGAPALLARGALGLDFADAGASTCASNATFNAGDSCVLNVRFSPAFSGQRNGAVQLRDSTGNVLASATVVGAGTGPQITFVPGTAAKLPAGTSLPSGVAVDFNGNVFFADSASGSIREALAAGGYTTVNTVATGFASPYGLALDGSGNLFVSDDSLGTVTELLAAGGYTTSIPLGGTFVFNTPTGLAVDGVGNVFVATGPSNGVYEILAASGYATVTPLAAAAANFNYPLGLAVDAVGNVFVADAGNNAVKEIAAAGGYTTVSAIGGAFALPAGVAVDPNGNVYVTDAGDGSVNLIVASSGYSTVNLLSTALNGPLFPAISQTGNLFVSNLDAVSFAGSLNELDFADGSTVTFPTPTKMTHTDTVDGPLHVTVVNFGNAPLSATAPGLVAPLDFAVVAGSGTPADCTASFSLAAGASCNLSIAFTPHSIASLSETLAVHDNSLNAPGTTQSITLKGTGINPGTAATLITPSSPLLTSTSVPFTWTKGSLVTLYQLLVGTTGVGSSNIYAGPYTAATSTTVTVPAAGGTLYVRLRSYGTGNWIWVDYTFTEQGIASKAALLTPTPNGSTLTGTSIPFTWTTGSGVTLYQLLVGSTGAGSYNIYGGAYVTSTSATVTVPAQGGTLYVRLRSFINGAWQYTDYTFVEAGTPVKAALVSPAPGSTFAGGSATFTWNTGSGVTLYQLLIGTTGAGSYNIYGGAYVTSTSATVTVPTQGGTLYVRLRSFINGAWQYTDYTFIEAGTAVAATLTSPVSGSTLAGPSATFSWSAGSGVTLYQLLIGTTGAGSYNIFGGPYTPATSATVTGIPTGGGYIYVRVRSFINGVWQYSDYILIEAGTPAKAVLSSPVPGSTLPGTSATFSWTAGSGVTLFQLQVGTTGVGSSNIYPGAYVTALSANVTSLPSTGGTVYVRLRSYIKGAWQYTDYTYTAF